MIEAGVPSTGELQESMARVCARPTGGNHGLTTDDPAQRFKGAMRRPRATGHRGSSAAKESIKAGAVEPQPDARRKGALEVDIATLNFVEYLFHALR